jgi:hypothetical protein
MSKLLIEPHYLGSVAQYAQLIKHDEVVFEIHQNFSKQSYKNRCYILTSQGTLPLTVPVKFGNRTAFKDVKLDNSQAWVREHWGAIYSAYGKSPFFEYFSEYFKSAWDKKRDYLLDLNIDFMTICLKLLQNDIQYSFTDSFQPEIENSVNDLREVIHPKKNLSDRKIFTPHAYSQNFGNDFVSNLSILDLLFTQGQQSMQVLKKSIFVE